MKIFASAAAEVNDDAEPPFEQNSRYSDDSTRYAAGFPFSFKLNSAMFNGILHRISMLVNERLHCNRSSIEPVDIPNYLSRYNTLSEIENLQYTDETNYILKKHINQFIQTRMLPFFLKKDEVLDFFIEAREKTYLSTTEATRCKALFFNTNLPPLLLNNFPKWTTIPPVNEQGTQAVNNRTHLFQINYNEPENSYTKLIIPQISTNTLVAFEVRNTRRQTIRIMSTVQFSESMIFQNRTIPNNQVYLSMGRTFLVIKGNRLLVANGLKDVSLETLTKNDMAKMLHSQSGG
jgi:hypothetical protein